MEDGPQETEPAVLPVCGAPSVCSQHVQVLNKRLMNE